MENDTGRKRLYALIFGYSIVIIVSYAVPVCLTSLEWYNLYSFLSTHKAIPFVDVREGYPPFGFLVYMPMYYIFQGNIQAFYYALRAVNGLFLVLTLFVLYLILKSTFNERRAVKLALYYAALPSVVIANVYSNDIIALFPAALAIYMMTKGKALLCGILIGVAALCKGFPFLLLIPALVAFKKAGDKLKVAGSAIFTVVFVSLPFMLMNPYTYISTFTHEGSRGPWETVWALIDGYYSHGGLLHPYFDKFFYHSNLLKIYSASHYDHAVYDWNFDWMPSFLTACQILIVILVFLACTSRVWEIYSYCGVFYIGYMLFFKGYSTQFAVSTPFYLLLATVNNPLPFLIPLEVSHILQMLAWGDNIVAPELMRDWHLNLLVLAVVIRTVVFGWSIVSHLKGVFTYIKTRLNFVMKSLLGFFRVLIDRKLLSLFAITILLGAMSLGDLYINAGKNLSFKSFGKSVMASTNEWQNITLTGLNVGDQVALKVKTHNWVEVKIVPDNLKAPIERGVRNPFNLKDSFNETVFFFIAESESYTLMLKLAHPAIPFRVTDGFDGDLKVNASVDGSGLVLALKDEGLDGRGSMFRIAYPLDVYVGNNFSLNLTYKVLEGSVSNLYLDIFDDTDEWLYSYNVKTTDGNFVLNARSKDSYGYSNLYGDHISLFALSIFIENGASTVMKLEGISVKNSDKNYDLKFYAMESEEIPCEIFIERDWKPTIYYLSSFSMFVVLGIVTFYFLYRKIKSYNSISTHIADM
jgi:4-amino-4-deoxy-L-arabinose transferase-like glycosyltransferase